MTLFLLAMSSLAALTGDKRLCGDETSEAVQYLRFSTSGFVKESEVQVQLTDQGIHIKSTTGRGDQMLAIRSHFDTNNSLITAHVTLRRGGEQQTAFAEVENNTATIVRHNGTRDRLMCPHGVIVTSAPRLD